jgi:hypothetical protein
MRGPSPNEALLETARLAYHFHWSLDTILDLEHADRRLFLAEASALAGERAHAGAIRSSPEPGRRPE